MTTQCKNPEQKSDLIILLILSYIVTSIYIFPTKHVE